MPSRRADADRYVLASYFQENLKYVSPGQLVEVSLDLYPGQIFSGKVASIWRRVDKGPFRSESSVFSVYRKLYRNDYAETAKGGEKTETTSMRPLYWGKFLVFRPNFGFGDLPGVLVTGRAIKECPG